MYIIVVYELDGSMTPQIFFVSEIADLLRIFMAHRHSAVSIFSLSGVGDRLIAGEDIRGAVD